MGPQLSGASRAALSLIRHTSTALDLRTYAGSKLRNRSCVKRRRDLVVLPEELRHFEKRGLRKILKPLVELL